MTPELLTEQELEELKLGVVSDDDLAKLLRAYEALVQQVAELSKEVVRHCRTIDTEKAAREAAELEAARVLQRNHELASRVAELEQAAQAVVDMLDPVRPKASAASLVATVTGCKNANTALRAKLERVARILRNPDPIRVDEQIASALAALS